MRITDYRINQCRRQRLRWCARAKKALLLDVPLDINKITARKANKEHKDVVRMQIRSEEICEVQFNLNALSDHKSIVDYRFERIDVRIISNMINLDEVTARNGYTCQRITTISPVLHCIGTPVE